MGSRLPIYLPRIAVLVLAALACTAGLTYAAGQSLQSTPSPATTPTTPKPATLVVPDLRNQAFVFAKGQLEDLGLAWRVSGAVRGFAANTVVSQSPAPGTKLIDTGSPLVIVTLARNTSYPQTGTPDDASSYAGTPIRLADAAVAAAPAIAKHPAVVKHATAAAPASKRTPDFIVPGAKKEPLDEIPLTLRATALGRWVAAHPKKTVANVNYWLYQNAWVVAGARMGWWHGASALRTLIAVDRRTESVWGIGTKSENVARHALAEVRARAK